MSKKRLRVTALLAAALLSAPAGAALGQDKGAKTIDCSEMFPGLGGTIVITPSGHLLANCFEHSRGTQTPASGGGATVVDCSEALGQEGAIGIQVITPTGGVFTNCHLHFKS